MKEITVSSFAKINLSIDVGECQDTGYHDVDMVMQQLAFHDDVTIRLHPAEEPQISLTTNRYYLPTDERNLAYKAAAIVCRMFPEKAAGQRIDIAIQKRIPVAGGMAGGSGNGAAVIHGLNALWGLDLSLQEIFRICEELGSDVPFSAAGQARCNHHLPERVRKDPMATSCVRARGRGTELTRVCGIRNPVVIAKPALSVSTAEVYRGIDHCEILKRPDNDQLVRDLRDGSDAVYENFINVLEYYTLTAYPEVLKLKERMQESDARCVLMSGSGPTVFGIFEEMDPAKALSQRLREEGYEAYWTRATK